MQPQEGSVKAWEEEVTIPTYPVGRPDKNPMFLEKRVYQGSSGVVYPLPMIEKIYDRKVDQPYRAIFLENRYLKIMILPQLGGRVHMAYDKIMGRHFVYYNRVIKPALVGLAGPWIAGGIELNWPQHHRPSTFDPVDYEIRDNGDGSWTVWVGEIERMFRTKGLAGFTLYPDRAYLEIRGRVYNRTPIPQTFLWWANPAVSVNEHYQSVFPPDVQAVFDHGKRDVSRFPISTSTYYKMDYSEGVDISRYKNLPVPTSYMAYRSEFDFLGGYDHHCRGGILHVADHHIAPGKKQWTWGCGDFGRAWDRNLTDQDGPYVELMTGVYTDNQPDFSWLQPGEEKSFSQYFLPYREIGMVKNANTEAALALEVEDRKARIGVYTTAPFSKLVIRLEGPQKLYLEETVDLSPQQVYLNTVSLEAGEREKHLRLAVHTAGGEELIAYTPPARKLEPIPEPARAVPPPEQIGTNEELYLAGLHLEQYRHATYLAEDYYREALKRDPGDARCNNSLGLLLLGRGQFAQSEKYFRRAIQRLTSRNPNPYDGEPFYNLGLSLRLQGRLREAYAAFYKSVWNGAWQGSGYLALAQIAGCQGQWPKALALVDKALAGNQNHHRARHLRVALLRRLQHYREAGREAAAALEADPLDFGARYEQCLLEQSRGENPAESLLDRKMRGQVHSYIEISLDYAQAGMYREAVDLLAGTLAEEKKRSGSLYPMVGYFLGYYHEQLGDPQQAVAYYRLGERMAPDYCFPNRLEAVGALQAAQKLNPGGPMAWYYLGNFWYAHRQYREAVACWEQSRKLLPDFPTVHRNLAIAYFNKQQDPPQAREALEQAYRLDPRDARVLMELDQLYKKTAVSPKARLALLEAQRDCVEARDDLYLEWITLYNLLGRHRQALELLKARRFHPWEGGEGKVIRQWVLSNREIARVCLEQKAYREGIAYLEAAASYPVNLGEGKLPGAKDNDLNYYLGRAFRKLGDREQAEACLTAASGGDHDPAEARYYNDQPADMILYQGLAYRQLGDEKGARRRFHRLVDYGERHIFDPVRIDYFAVSLPDLLIFEEDLKRRNEIHCRYLIALGNLGLGDHSRAREELGRVLELDPNHLGATLCLRRYP